MLTKSTIINWTVHDIKYSRCPCRPIFMIVITKIFITKIMANLNCDYDLNAVRSPQQTQVEKVHETLPSKYTCRA